MYQTVRRHSTEDSIVYCYRYVRHTELCRWRCRSETWTIMYQTVRRHSTEDSIVYCYRCHDNAGHIVFVHFEDTFPSIKSKAGVGLKSGWFFKGKEQIREENRRNCYCSPAVESLNDAVCGDGADYQFSTYFLLSSLLSPSRQYPYPARFNSSVFSLYEQMGVQISTAVT
jgi:hypothetical protein